MEEVLNKYNRDINCLRDRDKNTRLNGLKRLHSQLPLESQEETKQIFSLKLKAPLLENLSDPTDRCKELAVSLLLTLFSNSQILEDDVPSVVQALYSRLGTEPSPETCEEVRLKEVELLKHITQKVVVTPMLGEISDMLSKLAKDKFYEVKNKVAEIVQVLAQRDSKFGFYAKRLGEGLRGNLGHQRYLVRSMALSALGNLCLCEHAHPLVKELVPDFKKLQTDRKPDVKNVLYQTLHLFLMNLPFSYLKEVEADLIYLLIGGLADSDCAQSISEYLESSGNRRKELALDYQEEIQEIESSSGSRFLTLKNLREILDLSFKDIEEWTIQDLYRSRSLHVLIFATKTAESHVTPHLETLVKVLVAHYPHSQDPEYSALLEQCMEPIGTNCEYSLVLSIIRKHCLSDMSTVSEKAAALKLLRVVITVNDKSSLEVPSTIELLTSESLTTAEYSQVLSANLSAISGLVFILQSEVVDYKQSLFYALLMMENSEIAQSVTKVISALAEYCGLISASELYALQLADTLPKVIQNYKVWDKYSMNKSWFRTLMVKSGSAVFNYWETILEVLCENCKREKDTEVRYDMLVVLEHLINNEELSGKLKENTSRVIEGIVVPTGAWKAGVSSIQVRVASMLCLESLLNKRICEKEALGLSWEKLFSVLKTCLEDDWEAELRMTTTRLFLPLLEHYSEIFTEITLLDLYPELLKRLDDSQNPIRIQVTFPLVNFFEVVKQKLPHFGNYKYVVNNLFVHLDDNDTEVQTAVRKVLEKAMTINIQDFIEVASEAQQKHRHPRAVSELLILANSFK